jgi:hypothetical protein
MSAVAEHYCGMGLVMLSMSNVRLYLVNSMSSNFITQLILLLLMSFQENWAEGCYITTMSSRVVGRRGARARVNQPQLYVHHYINGIPNFVQ